MQEVSSNPLAINSTVLVSDKKKKHEALSNFTSNEIFEYQRGTRGTKFSTLENLISIYMIPGYPDTGIIYKGILQLYYCKIVI